MEIKNYHGIWVAKFEASSNTPNATDGGGDTTKLWINVKPNVISWRGITVNNIFTVCQNMTTSKGALEGLNLADSHLMKNVDWGAVAYLSQSKYGKNAQVWNNSNSSYKTGSAGTNKDAANEANTSEYNEGNGPEASTTGNVYGIYDIAGGGWEYVAGYIDNENVKTNGYNDNLINADEKYKDVYKTGTNDSHFQNYEANINRYGDAVYEIGDYKEGGEDVQESWQNDSFYYPWLDMPIFVRGGRSGNGISAGVFFLGALSR